MLRRIQSHLEAIYRIEAPDVGRFQIDRAQLLEVVGEGVRDAEEWVLVRQVEDGLDIAVFVDEAHLEALDTIGCLSKASQEAFPAFCAATEGVSHFLMLFERVRRCEPVRMLELEAQAEVDKFVSACLHHPEHSGEWWQRLFREANLAEGLDPEEVSRYLEAGRLAAGFCAALEAQPNVDAMLRYLREFWRASGAQRLESMRKMAG
jgi:hypothetical protein